MTLAWLPRLGVDTSLLPWHLGPLTVLRLQGKHSWVHKATLGSVLPRCFLMSAVWPCAGMLCTHDKSRYCVAQSILRAFFFFFLISTCFKVLMILLRFIGIHPFQTIGIRTQTWDPQPSTFSLFYTFLIAYGHSSIFNFSVFLETGTEVGKITEIIIFLPAPAVPVKPLTPFLLLF